MSTALDVVALSARRTWTKTIRRPVVLYFSLVQPLIWMTFFGFLFARYRLELAGEVAYLDFLAPGVSAMTVLFGASQSGIGWIRDLQTGFLPRLLNTPASPDALLAGKVLADVARLLAQALAVLALAWLLGARLTPPSTALVPAAAGLTLFAVAFSCVSCAVALGSRAQEAMAVFVQVVNMPLLFTSTALVPSRQMPEWLAAVARWNPLTLAVDGWRGALLFGEAPSWTSQVLPLAVLAVVLYALASWAMRRVGDQY
jgi:ABC-2 type transport system permease protein